MDDSSPIPDEVTVYDSEISFIDQTTGWRDEHGVTVSAAAPKAAQEPTRR